MKTFPDHFKIALELLQCADPERLGLFTSYFNLVGL